LLHPQAFKTGQLLSMVESYFGLTSSQKSPHHPGA